VSSRNFLGELKRRNVYKVAVAYAVAGWALAQGIAQVFPVFDIPNWAVRLIVLAIVIGFPIALVIAWAFELTPEGLKRTEDVDVATQRRAKPHAWIYIVIVSALVSISLFFLGRFTTSTRQNGATEILEKSIAVLPFENLSEDKSNAFFADGVQDEILTGLAKIADLKVISRTSVMAYKNTTRNLREIGQQLGVAHVLEGSVQRAGGKVRVNAQLIDTRTGAHQWAESYDRPVGDVFAIQSEIAKAIADQLRAQLSPREKAAVTEPPTTDLLANNLYIQAKELIASGSVDPAGNQKLLEAVSLLNQAVARDPRFLNAYCLLSQAHLFLYFEGFDHTPARRELANVAIQNASRFKPDAAEVHLELARYAYNGFRDYDRARAELEQARAALPNDPEVYLLTGFIDRRQGRWSEAISHFEHAIELDPRNLEILQFTANTYQGLRRYSESDRVCQQALAIAPDNYAMRLFIPTNHFLEWGDLGPLRTEVLKILSDGSSVANKICADLFDYALLARDRAAMNRALTAIPPEGLRAEFDLFMPREWYRAIAASAFGDSDTARASFAAARARMEEMLHSQSDHAMGWSVLGVIDANLGRKDEAVREGRQACEMLPLSADAWRGPSFILNLAMIYETIGDSNRATEQLRTAAEVENGAHYGELKLSPQWDALRADSRFEKIVASLAPKEIR
jgi:TolB-like protein/Flp pilus assembly protein TadD